MGRTGLAARAAFVAALAVGMMGRGASEAAQDSANGVAVRVDGASVVRRMQGGMGASWHAIENPEPHTDRGSAWGGNPVPDDDAAWEQVYRHASWLGFDWLRVEVEQRMYEPERGRFTWDSHDMRVLYRILDWCQSHGADVFLTQMWCNVAWNAHPEWRDDPVKRVHSAPASMEDFAEGLAALVEHLVEAKGYTCIKWLCIVNEPMPADWAWWRKPGGENESLAAGLAAVRKALDRRALAVALSAPDWTDLPPLNPAQIDFDPFIGAYDVHTYHANFDGAKDGYPMTEAERRLRGWADWAHARGKPLFLSEMGTMVFGWQNSHPGPAAWPAAIKDAEMVVRGIGAGVDAFNRWSFVNRGDLDGHWQMIETWDREAKRMRTAFAPCPNSYFVYGLLSRFTAKRSDILKCSVEGGREGEHARVFAAALRSPKGELTLAIVNDAGREWNATIEFSGIREGAKIYRGQVCEADRDKPDLRMEPRAMLVTEAGKSALSDRLPAMSLTIYTTYNRGHDAPGVMAEGE